jgi:hypothetical protein
MDRKRKNIANRYIEVQVLILLLIFQLLMIDHLVQLRVIMNSNKKNKSVLNQKRKMFKQAQIEQRIQNNQQMVIVFFIDRKKIDLLEGKKA